MEHCKDSKRHLADAILPAPPGGWRTSPGMASPRGIVWSKPRRSSFGNRKWHPLEIQAFRPAWPQRKVACGSLPAVALTGGSGVARAPQPEEPVCRRTRVGAQARSPLNPSQKMVNAGAIFLPSAGEQTQRATTGWARLGAPAVPARHGPTTNHRHRPAAAIRERKAKGPVSWPSAATASARSKISWAERVRGARAGKRRKVAGVAGPAASAPSIPPPPIGPAPPRSVDGPPPRGAAAAVAPGPRQGPPQGRLLARRRRGRSRRGARRRRRPGHWGCRRSQRPEPKAERRPTRGRRGRENARAGRRPIRPQGRGPLVCVRSPHHVEEAIQGTQSGEQGKILGAKNDASARRGAHRPPRAIPTAASRASRTRGVSAPSTAAVSLSSKSSWAEKPPGGWSGRR